MPIATMLNWMVALAPVVILLLAFEWLDVFHLIHIREIVILLLLGAAAGLSAWPVSGRVLDALPMGFSTYGRFVAPWIEEALKGLVIIGLFMRNRIGFRLDAAISGFAVGAGFSLVENCFYLLRLPELSFGVWLVRGFGTAVMHGGTVALFATLSHRLNLGLIREAAPSRHVAITRYVPGYLLAGAIHCGFNQFPDRPLIAMLGCLAIVPPALVAIIRSGEIDARGWLDAEEVVHQHALDELHAGNFPQTPSGQLVARLADRVNGRASPAMLRDYLEVHTVLVLRAEEMMRHSADGEPFPIGEEDRRLFAHLHELRRALGRTTLAALRPLLPFTPNDLWEMSELERAVAHHHLHPG